MSLKLVPFESLGAVSYSPSIVTVAVSVAVCEIYSVKEWRSIDHYGTFYWSAIVNIALYCTIFELFDVLNNIVTLKSGLEVTEGH